MKLSLVAVLVASCQAFQPGKPVRPKTALGVGNSWARRSPFGRSSSSSPPSSSRRGGVFGATHNLQKRKKTVQDRSQQEAVALINDIIRCVAEAGPRAGPRRTFQAYRAFDQTVREFLPQLASGSVNTPAILRTLFERMGATYIKLGQFIASSPTLFPKEYVVEFQKCLDQTEPLPWSTIRRVIEDELGPIAKTFEYVDQKPLASASIAQVHAGRLKTGEDIVIKVQKPGIDECLKADLSFLFVAARVLEYLQPDWERTSLSAVAGDLRASMLEELDFNKEALNTIEFGRFLQEYDLTSVATAPRIHLEHTTKRVMTMERLDGSSMLDEESIARVSGNPEMGQQTIITALNVWSKSVTSMPW